MISQFNRTCNIDRDPESCEKLKAVGLQARKKMYDDAHRYQGSVIGTHIIDTTYKAVDSNGRALSISNIAMHSNLDDQVVKMNLDDVLVVIDSEGQELEGKSKEHLVSLREILCNPRKYLPIKDGEGEVESSCVGMVLDGFREVECGAVGGGCEGES